MAGWLAGENGNNANSASVEVEVEVEAELGKIGVIFGTLYSYKQMFSVLVLSNAKNGTKS